LKPKPQQLAPAPIQENPSFLYLPGNIFFCQYVQVPPAISDEELQDFAEVTIGSLSPFPIDHIAWGWYKDPLQPWMLLYSATLESLARAGYRNLEEYRHVFPSFISTLPLQFDQPTIYFSYDPNTQTLTLHVHPGDQTLQEDPDMDEGVDYDEDLPDEDDLESSGLERLKKIKLPLVHSVHVPSPGLEDDADPDEDPEQVGLDELAEPEKSDEPSEKLSTHPAYSHIAAVRDSLLLQVPNSADYDVQDNWLEFATSIPLKNRELQFKNNWADIGESSPGPDTMLDREQVWYTDVRSLEFKATERDKRQKDRRLLLALKVAAIFMLLLVGMELGAVTAEMKFKGMQEQSAQDDPKVSNILAKNELLEKINNIATNNLMPFEMLQILNNHRPMALYFEEVEASEGKMMRIRGSSNTSGELNDYIKLLNDAEEVVVAEIDWIKKVGGKLTFEFHVDFIPFTVPELVIPNIPREDNPSEEVDPTGEPDDPSGEPQDPGSESKEDTGNPSKTPSNPLLLPSPGEPPALPPGLRPATSPPPKSSPPAQGS
jgi:hypothetical protein